MSAQSADVSSHLATRYESVRAQSEHLCAHLEVEDLCVQSMDDASPIKWHLAHTTWFFETFVLKVFSAGYAPEHPIYEHLFNSYYNGVGQPYPRPRRGQLSRPTVSEVYAYRRCVDDAMADLLKPGVDDEIAMHVELGLHHEQQHQELILTDLKHHFAQNPLYPVYRTSAEAPAREVPPLNYSAFDGGIVEVGARSGFCFDNELPRHRVLLEPFTLAERLTTNREYLAFVQDGGYQSSELWLSEGWSTVQQNNWQQPLYWHEQDGEWFEFRLDGLQKMALDAPAVHISAHEAFAYATWADARLPTEFEWESVAAGEEVLQAPENCFVESERYHPEGTHETGMSELFGQVWQWTGSSYGPYPGYRTLPGTLGEYNGKFMSSQLVLRGGSVATPRDHFRVSYRNFFYPPDRWQFTGIRLAR